MGGCQGSLQESPNRTIISSRESCQTRKKAATSNKISTSGVGKQANNDCSIKEEESSSRLANNRKNKLSKSQELKLENGQKTVEKSSQNIREKNGSDRKIYSQDSRATTSNEFGGVVLNSDISNNVLSNRLNNRPSTSTSNASLSCNNTRYNETTCNLLGSGSLDNECNNPWIIRNVDEKRTLKGSTVSLKRPYQPSEPDESFPTVQSRDLKLHDVISGAKELTESRPQSQRLIERLSCDVTSSDPRSQGPRSYDLRSQGPRTCDSRSKEGQSSRTCAELTPQQQERVQQQARHLVRGFDAMVVLIQYLTNREDLSFQSLCKQLAAQRSQLNSCRHQLSNVSEHNQALSSDLQAARQLVDVVNSRNEALVSENRKLKVEVKDMGRFRTSFVSDLGKLDSRLKDLTITNDRLMIENENFQDRLNEVEIENRDVIVRLNDVSKERDRAMTEKLDVTRQRDDAIRRHDDVIIELKKCKQERDELTIEVGRLKIEMHDVTNELNEVIKDRNDAMKERDDALQNQTELLEKLSEVYQEQRDIKKLGNKTEQDLERLKCEKDQLVIENKKMDQQLQQLREKVQNLERQLYAEKQQLYDESNKHKEELQAKIASLENSLQEAVIDKQLEAEKAELSKQLLTQKSEFKKQLLAQKAEFNKQLEVERMEHRQQLLAENKKVESQQQMASNKTVSKLRDIEAEYQKKINDLQYSHQAEVAKIKNVQQAELEKLKSELRNLSHTNKIELGRIKEEHSLKIAELEREQVANEKKYQLALQRLREESDDYIADTRNECNVKLKNFSNNRQITPSIVSGSSVDSGCLEGSVFSPRRSSAGGEYLEQEVESLRAVLDLRTEELHRLRKSADEMSKKLEEIPVLRDTVDKQRQKIENLEAVITLKADFERELSEKHQGLLRKSDRDSKALKRLSMDKEQLEWKLNHSEACLKSSKQSLDQLSLGCAGSTPDVLSNTASMDCLPALDQSSGKTSLRASHSKPQRPKSMVVLGSGGSRSRHTDSSSVMPSNAGRNNNDGDLNSAAGVAGTARGGSSILSRKVVRPSSASTLTSCSVGSGGAPGMEKLVEQRHFEDTAEIRQTDV